MILYLKFNNLQRIVPALLLLAAALNPSSSNAGFLYPDRSLVWFYAMAMSPAYTQSYVVPNEEYPADMIPIVQNAKPGIYMSVGTERGFIGAALAPKITHLLLVDRDPAVIKYNLTNIALLKASRSRRDYLRLRFATDVDVWRKALSKRQNYLSQIEKKILNSNSIQEWFRINQSSKLEAIPPTQDHLTNSARVANCRISFCFEEANYLYDDLLFHRVRSMALSDQIEVLRVNLGKEGRSEIGASSLSKIIEKISESKIRISVIDLSNAWDTIYIRAPDLHAFVKEIAAVSSDDTILMGTAQAAVERFDTRFQNDIVSRHLGMQRAYTMIQSWAYIGFRLGTLKTLGFGTDHHFLLQSLYSRSVVAIEREVLKLDHRSSGAQGYGLLSDIPKLRFTGKPVALFDRCEWALTDKGHEE